MKHFQLVVFGKLRSHERESVHVTSASPKDLQETRVEKRIGFQSNQPILNPNREKRPVLRRSMLIVVTKKLCIRKERGDPLLKRMYSKHVHMKTVRIPTLKRHMKERGDSLLKYSQKMCQTVLKHVPLMKAKRSTLETKHFVREWRDTLLTMTIQVMNEEIVSSERMERAVIETSEQMLNDQNDKLCNNPEVYNRTNQFRTQFNIERGNPLLEPTERGNPTLELTREPCKMEENIPFPGDRYTFFTRRSCQNR